MTPAGDESERRLSVLAHAAALMGLLLPTGQLLGPYLISLLAPPDATAVRRHAIEALNFQLNMLAILMLLLALLLWVRAGWGFFALFIPNLYAFGMALRAATRVSRGEGFRYPLTLCVIPPPQAERSVSSSVPS